MKLMKLARLICLLALSVGMSVGVATAQNGSEHKSGSTTTTTTMTAATTDAWTVDQQTKPTPQIPYPCCGPAAPNPDGSCPPGSKRIKNPFCNGNRPLQSVWSN